MTATDGIRRKMSNSRALLLASAAVSIYVIAAAAGAAFVTAHPPAPAPFLGAAKPKDLDLAELVPPSGRFDYVWYVPAGATVPQIAVAWHFRDKRPVVSWADTRRYVLTLWTPTERTPGSARWVPHALIRASPFPIVGRAVRLADVTGDRHD